MSVVEIIGASIEGVEDGWTERVSQSRVVSALAGLTWL